MSQPLLTKADAPCLVMAQRDLGYLPDFTGTIKAGDVILVHSVTDSLACARYTCDVRGSNITFFIPNELGSIARSAWTMVPKGTHFVCVNSRGDRVDRPIKNDIALSTLRDKWESLSFDRTMFRLDEIAWFTTVPGLFCGDVAPTDTCTCDSFALAWGGCKCGAFQREMEAKRRGV